MGRKTNAAVQARERARRARLKLDVDRDARDKRVEQAAADVFAGQLTAQGAEHTLTAAHLARDWAVASAERAISVALGRLRAEGLNREQIQTLTGLDPAELRRLLKPTAPKADPADGTPETSPTQVPGEHTGAPEPERGVPSGE